MKSQSEWEQIASEYKKEIRALWADIERASFELEKREPNSYIRGLNMLERSLDFSKESIRMLSYQEPLESKVNVVSPKKVKNERKILNVDEDRKRREEASFEWLYN